MSIPAEESHRQLPDFFCDDYSKNWWLLSQRKLSRQWTPRAQPQPLSFAPQIASIQAIMLLCEALADGLFLADFLQDRTCRAVLASEVKENCIEV